MHYEKEKESLQNQIDMFSKRSSELRIIYQN